MTDIEKARHLFQEAGLAFPTILQGVSRLGLVAPALTPGHLFCTCLIRRPRKGFDLVIYNK
jgi:hypothetical protein